MFLFFTVDIFLGALGMSERIAHDTEKKCLAEINLNIKYLI